MHELLNDYFTESVFITNKSSYKCYGYKQAIYLMVVGLYTAFLLHKAEMEKTTMTDFDWKVWFMIYKILIN